jgi:putative peptide zinc metalloprotease protein
LVVVEQSVDGRRSWVVKDPLSKRFALFGEQELALLDALDGRATIDELIAMFERRFAPRRMRPEDLTRFIASLHELEFVYSDRPGQGDVLMRRRGVQRLRSLRARLMSPLSMRFSGIDPTRLFDVLEPLGRMLFSRAAAWIAAVYCGAALLVVGMRLPRFLAELPAIEDYLTPANLLTVGAVLGTIKVLHEFGHGLACRRFGGECRDLGFMLLIFTPCLYCDITDAWSFPRRRHRLITAAAGIYVEFILAATAVFVWAVSAPGFTSQVALQVVVVASVTTVVFNGNPLMRYDGYYMLSDLVGTPNLGQRSAAVLRTWLAKSLYGRDAPQDPLTPREYRGWYAAYAVASAIYRWVLSCTIVLMLVAAARPYGLENLSRAVGVATLLTLIIGPLVYLWRLLPRTARWEEMNKCRAAVMALSVIVPAAAFLAVPLPHSVLGPCELQLRDAGRLYVEVPGRLTEVRLGYGTRVSANDVVATLENRDLELEIEELHGREAKLVVTLAALNRAAFAGDFAARTIPETEKLLASCRERLKTKEAEFAGLAIKAGREGTLFGTEPVPPEREGLSPSWTGRPLDRANLGCTLEVGTVLGQIGDPRRRQAAVVLEQDVIEYVHKGDTAEVVFDALPQETFTGKVIEIAIDDLKEGPRRLSAGSGGEVAGRKDAEGRERPTTTSYLARVELDDAGDRFREGWRGTARIRVGPKPMAARLWRSLSRTFQFDL